MSGRAATPGVSTATDRTAAAASIKDLRLRMGTTITQNSPAVEIPRVGKAGVLACLMPPLLAAGLTLSWPTLCSAAAAAAPGSEHPWKLTIGEYFYAAYLGTDVN